MLVILSFLVNLCMWVLFVVIIFFVYEVIVVGCVLGLVMMYCYWDFMVCLCFIVICFVVWWFEFV